MLFGLAHRIGLTYLMVNLIFFNTSPCSGLGPLEFLALWALDFVGIFGRVHMDE
jgi:hypothetical protein